MLPDELITKMRADYIRVAADLRTQWGWTDAEIDEYGATFKSAIGSGDVERVNAAAAHLAALVRRIEAMRMLFVEMEERMRQQKGIKNG